MKKMIQPIATITNTSGIEGAIKLRPLSRYFEDYINGKTFFIGISSDQLKSYYLEKIEGDGKSRRFKFEGFKTISQAKKIVGKTIFIEADLDAEILMISEQVLGYQIVCNDGLVVGSQLCKEITRSLKLRQNPVTNLSRMVYNLKRKII